jgi:poly(ADP-ribose) glycohydrolase
MVTMMRGMTMAGTNENILENHTLLPCFYTNENQGEIDDYDVEKWKRIEDNLKNPIDSFNEFKEIYSKINLKSVDELTFETLEKFCKEDEKKFVSIVQNLQKNILEMPKLFQKDSIPVLTCTSETPEKKVTLTKKQIRCLLSSAFFGVLIPSQTAKSVNNADFLFCQHLDFDMILDGVREDMMAKLKCLMNYFERVSTEDLKGNVSFHRKKLEKLPNFKESKKKIPNCEVYNNNSDKKGFEFFDGCLQADFANKYIGGGVLRYGSVQEEILFMIKPECLVSLLFCPVLESDETILIRGAEKFSEYKGYAQSFEFASNFQDENKMLEDDHLDNQILAFDANEGEDDYEPDNIHRELTKVYCGVSDWTGIEKKTLVTGNWGCGAFGGDLQMKSLIQILAAAEADRNLIYHAFNQIEFSEDLKNLLKTISEKEVTVGQLYTIMTEGFKAELADFRRIQNAVFTKIENSLKE